MTRVALRVISAALVLAMAVGIWWLLKPSTRHVSTKSAVSSYTTQSVAVGSQQAAAHDTRALVLQSSMLGAGDRGLRAAVVEESASAVFVSMTYEKFECDGCARTAQGLIGSVTVHLHDPLGRRAVIDDFTHRAVRYQKLP